jgi:hypothetical protein
MELASMLAGEPFTDHPRSVCPTIAALLRVYNDTLGDRERQDLFRYASAAVDTRQGYELQEHRARFAVAWARSKQLGRRRRFLFLRRPAAMPRNGTPIEVAEYVVETLENRRTRGSHTAMMGLLDWLIAMRPRTQVPDDRTAVARAAAGGHEFSLARLA